MVDFDKIWVEKYRPHKLDDLILDDKSLRVVKQFEDEIPNLLFAVRTNPQYQGNAS